MKDQGSTSQTSDNRKAATDQANVDSPHSSAGNVGNSAPAVTIGGTSGQGSNTSANIATAGSTVVRLSEGSSVNTGFKAGDVKGNVTIGDVTGQAKDIAANFSQTVKDLASTFTGTLSHATAGQSGTGVGTDPANAPATDAGQSRVSSSGKWYYLVGLVVAISGAYYFFKRRK